jgi:hypothetical protein
MDQKDEFSKWMSAVEEALSSEGKELAEDIPSANECSCGHWDCVVCFPSQDEMPGMHGALDGVGGSKPEDTVVVGGAPMAEPGQLGSDSMDQMATDIEAGINDIEADSVFNDGLEEVEVGMFDEDDEDPVAAFKATGGQVTQLPYMNKPRSSGLSFGSKHIGSQTGQGSRGQQRGHGAAVSVGRATGGKPVVGEEEQDFTQAEAPVEKSRTGKGVKLGDIVTKTEFKKTGGGDSPMTYGDDNLDEGPDDINFDGPEELEMGSPLSKRDYAGEMSQIDPEEAIEKISQITYMQDMGLSNSRNVYDENQLSGLTADELRKVHQEVTGNVAEATAIADPEDEPVPPKPTKTRTKSFDPYADLDDVLNPRPAQPLANIPGPEDDGDVAAPDEPSVSLPAASRDATQNRLRNMSPSDTMRDYMSRINPEAGATEPELPDTPQTELVLRTASDLPAVIGSAMQAAGVQSPEWHHVRNLPGYQDRNTRGMGRSVFSMFTSTPIENIQTIANVEGQGPNTDAELRAVAGWLRDNAEDLGDVELDHGMAIPGYKPDVKEYRAHGIRFHVVRDPMGQYIYAYPDTDARLSGPAAGQGQGRLRGGRNTPRLGESTQGENMKLIGRPTLFEQLKWDEEINAILREAAAIEEVELDESTLSKKIGKQKGGQRLVQWLHRRHKLANEADLVPAPFSERLLWKEFKSNPDNFVIVSAVGGVAGVKPHEEFIKKRTAEFAKKGRTYNPSGDSTLPYQIIAFTDDGEQVDPNLLRQPTEPGEEPEERHPDPTVMRARMGKISGKDMQNPYNTFNLLADQIGALKTVWVASGAIERDKIKSRADAKVQPEMQEMDAVKKIFNRVRPILKTLGNQALSQIHNRAKRYIDGGNFEAATKVAQSGDRLKKFLATIDTTGEVNLNTSYGHTMKPFTDNIIRAVVKASGSQQGTDEYKDFLNKAANGSAIELKPVLDSLRDSLVELM